jgi:hypothetical protein
MVRDNGMGHDPSATHADSTGFGLGMMQTFASKLKAEWSIKNEGGTMVALLIRAYRKASTGPVENANTRLQYVVEAGGTDRRTIRSCSHFAPTINARSAWRWTGMCDSARRAYGAMLECS